MERKNYRVFVVVDNLQTEDVELVFDNFIIKKITSAGDRVKWREKMQSRRIPEYFLEKIYKDYEKQDNDVSGFDSIMDDIMRVLLSFRLFKTGDIYFNDMIIEDIDGKNTYLSHYNMAYLSTYIYPFCKDEIGKFNIHIKTIIKRIEDSNNIFSYCLSMFMQGCNREFNYHLHGIRRIVDYIICFEAIFVPAEHWFIGRTISERVSRFIDKPESKTIIKRMYAERSNIVHGNNTDLDEKKIEKYLNDIRKYMPQFEAIIRSALYKLLFHGFQSKKAVSDFMSRLYCQPREVIEIMEKAKSCAEQLLPE